KQMVLDMKVRWSSTYAMFDCGYNLRADVDKFVFEIAMDETGEKCKKLVELQLTEAEWSRVNLFLDLLFAEHSQHQFSSDLKSTLHLALSALEALHNGWTQCTADLKYSHFKDALKQALEKVDEYYQKPSNSDAYMLAMVLDPAHKLSYFKKHWPKDLQEEALDAMEETFKQRYFQLLGHSSGTGTSILVKKSAKPTKMRQPIVLQDDNISTTESHIDPLKPWLDEYQLYFNVREVVPQGMDAIQWWGINSHRYPVWALLARDYLAIMSSSVSSEHAFSSAGITISNVMIPGYFIYSALTLKTRSSCYDRFPLNSYPSHLSLETPFLLLGSYDHLVYIGPVP
ncbi:ribonuclease H-like domain-containing protein, partial [Mycena epipterygia]